MAKSLREIRWKCISFTRNRAGILATHRSRTRLAIEPNALQRHRSARALMCESRRCWLRWLSNEVRHDECLAVSLAMESEHLEMMLGFFCGSTSACGRLLQMGRQDMEAIAGRPTNEEPLRIHLQFPHDLALPRFPRPLFDFSSHPDHIANPDIEVAVSFDLFGLFGKSSSLLGLFHCPWNIL